MKKIHLILMLPVFLTGCAGLPSLDDRPESHYLDIRSAPRMDALLNTATAKTGGDISNVYLLNDAHEAFVARAALIEAADHTLDLQYYIWHNDISGKLMFNLIHRAAERGVRVRLLLDDNNTNGLDNVLLALDSHPNIEIRLFNPFDILATGRVVTEVSQDFDRYWASHSSYTVASIIKKGDIEKGFQEMGYDDKDKSDTVNRYRRSIEESELYQKMQSNSIDWQSVHTRLISDDPAKGLDRDRHKLPIFERMQNALKTPKKSIYLVSPYFVPTKSGVRALDRLVKDGVDVTVLTNSLQATDVTAVHSGYAKYRKPMLKAGVKLYELQPNHAVPTTKDRGLTGSSATSLHAKTFIVDEKRVFIGSFNLDPRSARLNTEMGVVLESPKIAGEMQRTLVNTTPKYAYQVTLDKYNKLHWHDPATQKTYSAEPEAKFWKRVTSKIFSFLPIEGLL